MKKETSYASQQPRMGKHMLSEAQVKTVVAMHASGHAKAAIARAVDWSRAQVDRYLALGRWQLSSKRCQGCLSGLDDWLQERLLRHGGNADVVRQDLQREHSLDVSLRSVERAVAVLRHEHAAATKATVRYETPPGRQLQIDFGEKRVAIQGEQQRSCVFAGCCRSRNSPSQVGRADGRSAVARAGSRILRLMLSST